MNFGKCEVCGQNKILDSNNICVNNPCTKPSAQETIKELLAEQEKKINILLEALGEISKMYDEDDDPKDWHHITCANKALEEYKKE